MTTEAPLIGGRTTLGLVRVGKTVRRPPVMNSNFVQGLLRHLEAAGFDGAPHWLGVDAKGRDVLSWIEGDVPAELSATHSDAMLADAARLIRRYHDATVPLLAAPAAISAGLEVVCHNDLSPCNFVFRTGVPVALIDFDGAAPGTRAHDLGYAAWLWLDLGNTDVAAPEQRRRLNVFLRYYGSGPTCTDVVRAILQRQNLLVSQGLRMGDRTIGEWAQRCHAWTRAFLCDEAII